MPENVLSEKVLLKNGFIKENHTVQGKNWGGKEIAVLNEFTYTMKHMEEIGYPEILSEETDLHKIEKMLEGYDLREFQSSQYVGQAPIDTSMVLSKVIYPAYILNPQVKEKVEQALYEMLFGTDFDVYIVTLYVISELFKEKNNITPFKMELGKILNQLKIELSRRKTDIQSGVSYPNGYIKLSAWDELMRLNHVCQEEYQIAIL